MCADADGDEHSKKRVHYAHARRHGIGLFAQVSLHRECVLLYMYVYVYICMYKNTSTRSDNKQSKNINRRDSCNTMLRANRAKAYAFTGAPTC